MAGSTSPLHPDAPGLPHRPILLSTLLLNGGTSLLIHGLAGLSLLWWVLAAFVGGLVLWVALAPGTASILTSAWYELKREDGVFRLYMHGHYPNGVE